MGRQRRVPEARRDARTAAPAPAPASPEPVGTPRTHDQAETLQRAYGNQAVARAAQRAASGAAQPLPDGVRQEMEAAFDADFSTVRVSEGPEAAQLGALAYTQGEQIHLQPGLLDSQSESGRSLLGHELTHVLQQRAGRVVAPSGAGAPINADSALEAEAEVSGARAARGAPAPVQAGGYHHGQGASGDAGAPVQRKVVAVFDGNRYRYKDDSLPGNLLFDSPAALLQYQMETGPYKGVPFLDDLTHFDLYAGTTHGWEPDQWQMSADTWDAQGKSADEQFKRDAIIMLNTMFPDPAVVKDLAKQGAVTQEQLSQEQNKRQFLIRLNLAMAIGGLKYSDQANPNASQLVDWDLPMAAALAHGQRVIFDIDSANMEKRELMDFLVDDPAILNSRSFASHSVTRSGGKLVEHKHKLGKYGKNTHYGVNLSLGGLGSPTVNEGQIVGPGGNPLGATAKGLKRVPKRQHGHVYLNTTGLDGNHEALMVGLENAQAGGGKSMWGKSHGATGAAADQTKSRAALGGDKMSKLTGLQRLPAEYGGKQVKFDQQTMARLYQVSREFAELDEGDQRTFMQKLLVSTGPEAKALIDRYFPHYKTLET